MKHSSLHEEGDLENVLLAYRRRLSRVNQEIREGRKVGTIDPDVKVRRKELDGIVSRLENLRRSPSPPTEQQVQMYTNLYMST